MSSDVGSPHNYTLMNLELFPPQEVRQEFSYTPETEKSVMESLIDKIAKLSVACFVKANRQKMIAERLRGSQNVKEIQDSWSANEKTDLTFEESESLSATYKELLMIKLNKKDCLVLKNWDYGSSLLGQAIRTENLNKKWHSIFDCLRFDATRTVDLKLYRDRKCFEVRISKGGPDGIFF